jgi:signal recognition particle GTPase
MARKSRAFSRGPPDDREQDPAVESHDVAPLVFLVTGIPGAGKTTVEAIMSA